MSCFFTIVNSNDKSAFSARNAINWQLGLLPGMCGLRTIALEITLGENLDIWSLERSMPRYEAALLAIIACAEQASFALAVDGGCDLGHQTACSLLVMMLRPFRRQGNLEKLDFKYLYYDQVPDPAAGENEAYEIFQELAPNLLELSCTGESWLSRYREPLQFTRLQKLDIRYSDMAEYEEEDVMDRMRSMVAMVNYCGPRLRRLDLSIDWYIDETNVGLARSVFSDLRGRKLNTLCLHDATFVYTSDWLQSVQVRELHIDISASTSWNSLEQFLSDEPAFLQRLSSLTLYIQVGYDWGAMTTDKYSIIKEAAKAHAVKLRLHVQPLYLNNLDSMNACLSMIQEEVFNLSLSLPEPKPEQIYRHDWPNFEFVRLGKLAISYNEGIGDGSGKKSQAFAILLGRVNAPKLLKLKVAISTPYLLHLQALITSISFSKPGQLQTINGYFAIGVQGHTWHDPMRNHLKKQFLEVCGKKGIAVHDLAWK